VKHLLGEAPWLVETVDEGGATPLHCAALGASANVIASLIAAGAKTDARDEAGCGDVTCLPGSSPLTRFFLSIPIPVRILLVVGEGGMLGL
jgi:ankyrin repeat protein